MLGSVQIEMSLADPPGSSVVLAATDWVQGTLLGTLATVIALIAVAVIGFLMLSGRVDARRGVTVLLGCFVLFGAHAIANGLRAMTGNVGFEYAARAIPIQRSQPLLVDPQPVTTGIDPYAGASVQR